MRAGELTERVELLRPVFDNGTVGKTRIFESAGITSAQIQPGAGYGTESAGEMFGAQKAVFLIRDKVIPLRGWRLRHIGGLEYNIVTDGMRIRSLGMVKLTCERVNK